MSKAIADTFLARHPKIEHIDLLLPDLNAVPRGKRIRAQDLHKIIADGILLPASVFALDITGETVEETGIGIDIGDMDLPCNARPDTLVPVPWQPHCGQMMLEMVDEDANPYFGDPRTVLRNITQRFHARGLKPVTAVELEFYLFDTTSLAQGEPLPPIAPKSGIRDEGTQVYAIDNISEYEDFVTQVMEATRQQGLPADAVVAEYAPGQFEVNLHHVDDPVAACDHAVLLKRVIRQVARRCGFMASFMAKPYIDNAGCGTHVHVSLNNEHGENVFAGDDEEGSPLLRQAIAGLLETMDESMALFAGNPNSFRRFSPNMYVPCSHVWGVNNRSTALRIPAGPLSATRIEHRVAGADANPYLVMAAVLMGIDVGLVEQLTAPPPVEGNAYEQFPPDVPDNLRDALRIFEKSPYIADYFGEQFQHIYTQNKWSELYKFEQQITPLEFQWYLTQF